MNISGFTKLRIVSALLLCSPACWASTIYQVTIDTSSQSGNNGGIYFQFNGGLDPDPASVSISSFVIGAPGSLSALPAPVGNGGVTGSLDSLPLVIDNSGGNNDYLHFLTFGPTLFFQVSVDFTSPLTGSSGSAFSFGLTADDGLTPVLTGDPNGFNGQISYDTAGVFTASTLGNDAIETIAPVASSGVPEPGTALLMTLAIAAIAFLRRACRAQRQCRTVSFRV